MPESNKNEPKGAKAKAVARGNRPAESSGQVPANKNRDDAPQPTKARKQNAGGEQGATGRTQNTSSKRSGT